MNNRHPCQLNKSKSWGPFWSYQVNSSQHCQFSPFIKKIGKMGWIGRAQDFDFFNCHGCQTFILAKIHCCISTLKSWHNDLFLSDVPYHSCLKSPFKSQVKDFDSWFEIFFQHLWWKKCHTHMSSSQHSLSGNSESTRHKSGKSHLCAVLKKNDIVAG